MKKNLKELLNHIFIVLGNSLPHHPFCDRNRRVFYRLAGMNIGKRVIISGPFTLGVASTNNVIIGDGTYMNTETRFGSDDVIEIGKSCHIGPRVCFESSGHGLVYQEGKGRGHTKKPIIVKDKVWIGAGAMILQGVTVHEGAVIAAGAVVNKDVEAYTVAGGVPAKKIKDIVPM